MARLKQIPIISYEQTSEHNDDVLAAAFNWLFDTVAERRTVLAIAGKDNNHKYKELTDEESSSISRNPDKHKE
jgi:hypothetical protein